MKKKKIDNFIKEDFETTYNCDITVEDILTKTDFFDQKEPIKTKPSIFSLIFSRPNLKYTTSIFACLLIVIVGIINIPGMIEKKQYDILDPEDMYNEYLTNEEAELINNNSMINEYNYYKEYKIDGKIDFYFFRGITKDNEYIYFVKYLTEEDIPSIIVNIDNNKVFIEENKLVILTIREEVEKPIDTLNMIIQYNDLIVEYTTEIHNIR